MSLLTIRAMTAAATITGTPPVTQDLNVGSGPGESPKAALYEVTGGSTIGTLADSGRIGIGMTDGTSQYAIGCVWEDAVTASTADCDGRSDNATVIQFPTVAGSSALDGEASWAQWNTDGSQVSWADLLATALQLKATYFFGTACQAHIELVVTASVDVTTTVSGLPFRPNLMIALGGGAAWTADSTFSNARYAVGYACQDSFTGAILQAGTWCSGLDRTNPTACAQSLYDTGLFRAVTASAGGVTNSARIEVTAIRDTEVDFTNLDTAAGVTIPVLFLGLPKHRCWVGIPSLVTSSTGNKSLTEPGFKPKAYFLIGTRFATKNTTDGSTVAVHVSHGVATTSESACAGLQAEDNTSTSDTRSIMTSTVAHVLNDAAGIDWSASHVSMGPLGPVINIDNASGADRLVVLCAISEDPVLQPSLLKTRQRRLSSRRRRLAA